MTNINPALRKAIILNEPIQGALGVDAADLAQPRRVYQHAVGQTYKDVAFSGAYTSLVGNLQVRARSVATGLAAVDWADATPGAANSFTKTMRLAMTDQWVWLDTR